jgi:hypothetical protein
MAIIDRFEFTSYGELKLNTYKDGRSTETTYHDIPKSILIWLLERKTAPEQGDIDKKIHAYREKHKKEYTIACYDFWSEED